MKDDRSRDICVQLVKYDIVNCVSKRSNSHNVQLQSQVEQTQRSEEIEK